MTDLQTRLFAEQDLSYRAFNSRLLPTVNPETVIGVRTPRLRAIAKEIAGSPQAAVFLAELPHRYYEENNLHAFLIERIGDYNATVAELDRFLPYVDNWGTCDSMSPKCFRRHRSELRRVRFAIRMLMNEFLDDEFSPDDLARLAAIQTEEYYIRMMVAWYFATALAKRYQAILPYLRENRLDPVVKAMAIRKARESFRISQEQKDELLRIARDS